MQPGFHQYSQGSPLVSRLLNLENKFADVDEISMTWRVTSDSQGVVCLGYWRIWTHQTWTRSPIHYEQVTVGLKCHTESCDWKNLFKK